MQQSHAHAPRSSAPCSYMLVHAKSPVRADAGCRAVGPQQPASSAHGARLRECRVTSERACRLSRNMLPSTCHVRRQPLAMRVPRLQCVRMQVGDEHALVNLPCRASSLERACKEGPVLCSACRWQRALAQQVESLHGTFGCASAVSAARADAGQRGALLQQGATSGRIRSYATAKSTVDAQMHRCGMLRRALS